MNKKIRGATTTINNGIKFKSALESSCYNKLQQSGLEFTYEEETITLWDKSKLENVKVYQPKSLGNGKYGKELLLFENRALRAITYTPDFVVIKDNYKIYFDVKGKENDTYPIKKKMFLKHLECRNDNFTYLFFEPHSVKQMLQAIEIIKSL